jgi:hypothetical protein
MDIDRDHVDEAIFGLLFLGRHDGMRTWNRLGRDGAAPYKAINLGSRRQS